MRVDPHYNLTYNRKELICKLNLEPELLDKEVKEFRRAVNLVCTLERAAMIYTSKRELFTQVAI